MSRCGRAIDLLYDWRNGQNREHTHEYGDMTCERCTSDMKAWDIITSLDNINPMFRPDKNETDQLRTRTSELVWHITRGYDDRLLDDGEWYDQLSEIMRELIDLLGLNTADHGRFAARPNRYELEPERSRSHDRHTDADERQVQR